MDIYAQAVQFIIKEQQNIIGPLALLQAQKVAGLSASSDEVKIQGDGKQVLEHLVEQYEKIFGKTSVEVCKQAIQPLASQFSPAQLPEILKN